MCIMIVVIPQLLQLNEGGVSVKLTKKVRVTRLVTCSVLDGLASVLIKIDMTRGLPSQTENQTLYKTLLSVLRLQHFNHSSLTITSHISTQQAFIDSHQLTRSKWKEPSGWV